MINRAFKLRFRRRLRLRKRQVEELSVQAEQHLEQNFFRRLERLIEVRRFVASWLLLLILLSGCMVAQARSLNQYYQVLQPAPGGTYSEGIVGSFTNANPLYAANPVDAAVSHLIFAGLYTYNDQNQLVGDLAAGPYAVDSRGTTYTVHLRPNLTWHDGRPLTADDVVFTYQAIQNPDAQSPLQFGWQGIKVAALDPLTVTFTLPNPLSSFPYSMTNGIIPKHLLGGASMAEMRTLAFNTRHPVGAGPFQWSGLEVSGGSAEDRQEQIALTAFGKYHARAPKLKGFVVHSFRSQDQLVRAFQHQEIMGVAGLTDVPEALRHDSLRAYSLPLAAEVMTFFRTSEGVLSDTKVRQALVQATDTYAVLRSLDHAAVAAHEPLLKNQPGFNPQYAQAAYDPGAAGVLLDGAGWKPSSDGIRRKGNIRLNFKLYAQNNSEYAILAHVLQKQWRAVGVDAQVFLQDAADFQSTLAYHSYDALLYGIAIGPDPDVYVYWDSTQADIRSPNRLNLSEYKSIAADVALEAGRTRSDPNLRAVKYAPFLQAWQKDAPAVALYQPRFLYITRVPIYGLTEHTINADVERFTNVHNWMIRTVGKSQ